MRTERMTLQQRAVACLVLSLGRLEAPPTTREVGQEQVPRRFYDDRVRWVRLGYDAANGTLKRLRDRGIVEPAGVGADGGRTWKVTAEALPVVEGWMAEIKTMEADR